MGSTEAGRSSSVAVMVAGCLLVAVSTMMLCSVGVVVGEDKTLASKCGGEFEKVTACLNYATGKEDSPTKECCGAVTDIRGKDPACLCYFIQQTHNGSDTIKSMGILESRLLQLPSACSIKNASISECPKLLGIPPTSPDYAIFTNASAPASPTGTSSAVEANTKSLAAKHGPAVPTLLLIMAVVFLSALSTGPGSKLVGLS